MTGQLLVATAVDAERVAVLAGLADRPDPTSTSAGFVAVDVIAVGVGPAAAAAATARVLAQAEAAGRRYDAVLCAGIAGGLPGRALPGELVLATAMVAADLGADAPDGKYLPLDELGYGTTELPSDPALLDILRRWLPAATVEGQVLSVSTVTGTAVRTEALATRYPDARAEAMEGFGVATAALGAGVPCAELRAISNVVGPRDRSAWRIPAAMATLRSAFAIDT